MKRIDDLLANNPWGGGNYLPRIIAQTNEYIGHHLYYDNLNVIHPDDKQIIEAYNKKNKSDCQFNTHLLAAPFQGNPLCAKVVFLSLNPGYVERINKDTALMLENTNTTHFSLRINEIYTEFLEHRRTAIFPSKEKDGIHLYTAYQLLSDWYWYDMFANLRKDCKLDDDQFAEKVAIMQLIPYHSAKCENVITNLPTQQYTRELILSMLEQPNCPIFVVMRSEKKWAELLGIDFKDPKYIDKFILRKRDKNNHLPRKQFITSKAFERENTDYNTIVTAIKSN